MDEFNLDEIYDNLVKAEFGPPESLAQDPILMELKNRSPHRRIQALKNSEVKLHHLLVGIRDRDANVVAAAASNGLLPPQFLRLLWKHPNPVVRRNVLSNPSLPPEVIDEMIASGLEHLSAGNEGYQRYHAIADFVQNPALREHHLGQIQQMITAPGAMRRDQRGNLNGLLDSIIQHPSYNSQMLNQSVLDALNDPTGSKNKLLDAAMSSPNLLPETISEVLSRGKLAQTHTEPGNTHQSEHDQHLSPLVDRDDLTSGHLMQILQHPNMPGEIIESIYKHKNLRPEHTEQIFLGPQESRRHVGWYKLNEIIGNESAWNPELMDKVFTSPDVEDDVKERLTRVMNTPSLLNGLEKGTDTRSRLTALNVLKQRDDVTPEIRNAAAKIALADPEHSLHESVLGFDEPLDPALLDWYARQESPDNGNLRARAAGRPESLPSTVDFIANHPDPNMRAYASRNAGVKLTPEHISRFLADPDPAIRRNMLASHDDRMSPEHFQYVFDHPELFDGYHRAQLMSHENFPPATLETALFSDDDYVNERAAKQPRLRPEAAWRYLDDPNGLFSIKSALVANKNIPLQPRHLEAMLHGTDSYEISKAINHHSITINQLKDLLGNQEWQTKHAEFGDLIRDRLTEFDPDSAYSPVSVRLSTGKLRKVRDLILKSGNDEMKPRDLPPGDWSAGRMPNGNISAKKLQAAIDSLPATRYNTSERDWDGAQRHSDETQKVMQLNLSTDMLTKLKEQGLYNYWTKVTNPFVGSHPSHKHTVGWVRYTGTPQDGIFIDEVQSDIANSPHAKGAAYAKRNIDQGDYSTPEAYQQAVNQQVERARKNADTHFGPEEHHKAMLKVIFGNKHPNEVLHEAFQQTLRDQGHIGTKVAVHTPKTKAKISNLEEGEAVPVHFKIAYEDHPKKMGMEPGKYSRDVMPTMSGDEVEQGAPVWTEQVRKYEKLQEAIRKLILAKLEK